MVMIDRMSRRYVFEHLNQIAQDDVIDAIRRMKARKAPPVVRSVTMDNGSDFLDQKRLDRAFGSEVYYTRATPPTRKSRSRTATASSGGGSPRARTSTSSRAARSGASRTQSTQSTDCHQTEKAHMRTILVWPRYIKEFLMTHLGCNSPTAFYLASKYPL